MNGFGREHGTYPRPCIMETAFDFEGCDEYWCLKHLRRPTRHRDELNGLAKTGSSLANPQASKSDAGFVDSIPKERWKLKQGDTIRLPPDVQVTPPSPSEAVLDSAMLNILTRLHCLETLLDNCTYRLKFCEENHCQRWHILEDRVEGLRLQGDANIREVERNLSARQAHLEERLRTIDRQIDHAEATMVKMETEWTAQVTPILQHTERLTKLQKLLNNKHKGKLEEKVNRITDQMLAMQEEMSFLGREVSTNQDSTLQALEERARDMDLTQSMLARTASEVAYLHQMVQEIERPRSPKPVLLNVDMKMPEGPLQGSTFLQEAKTVVANEGRAWDQSSGCFVTPRDGVYMLAADAWQTDEEGQVGVGIQMYHPEGVQAQKWWALTRTNTARDVSTAVCMERLRKGWKVAVAIGTITKSPRLKHCFFRAAWLGQ